MFYIVSKITWFIVQPLNLFIFAVLLAGLLSFTRFHDTCRVLLIGGGIGLAVAGFSPLGFLLLGPLEDPHRIAQLPETADGIIILGGEIDWLVTVGRDRPELAAAADRLTSAVALSLLYPEALVVYSAQGGRPFASVTDSDIGQLLLSLGVAESRIRLESNSRNTDENVKYLLSMPEISINQRWIVVTSAFHMSRALSVFKRHNWSVVPFATDFRSPGPKADWPFFHNTIDYFRNVNLATKEWIGMLVYLITKRAAN